jgi:hypothetical protein
MADAIGGGITHFGMPLHQDLKSVCGFRDTISITAIIDTGFGHEQSFASTVAGIADRRMA